MIYQDVPAMVRAYRQRMGYSQSDLAKKLKVSRSYVAMVENKVLMDPSMFCVRLYEILPPDEQKVLLSLMVETQMEAKFRAAKKKGLI